MVLTDTFYLTAESYRLWIDTTPETVLVDANNVQKIPLNIRLWAGEGSGKVEMPAYITLKVESVAGSVTTLYSYASSGKVTSYSYTIPAAQYPTANRISIYAHEDAERTKEIDCKQVNIIAENATPFPRPENWSSELVFKNGEYLIMDNVVYMWSSRVSGNTTVSPKVDLSSSTPSGKWKSYQEWTLLATQVLLAKFGMIGSAVFKDEYMYSQQGTNAAGSPTNDYRKFGTNDFTPNLMIDFFTGLFKGRKIEVDGGVFKNVTSPNGAFKINEAGSIEIVGKISTSMNGTRIEINPENNSIRMYNQDNNEVGILDFFTETGSGLPLSLPRIRLRRYTQNSLYAEMLIRDSYINSFSYVGADRYGFHLDTESLYFTKNNVVTKEYKNT